MLKINVNDVFGLTEEVCKNIVDRVYTILNKANDFKELFNLLDKEFKNRKEKDFALYVVGRRFMRYLSKRKV